MAARVRLVSLLAVAVAAVTLVVFLIRWAGAAETDISVEPSGRWHVDGETFWFGAPGDVFLTGPALGFAGGENASDYAVWRDGEVFFAGNLVGEVRETASVVAVGLPTDIPVVISFDHGSPSGVGYIRDGVVYGSDDDPVVGWFDEDVPGAPGARLAPRAAVRVPVGQLREALAEGMGHPLLDWRLRLEGNYHCATEGPGDIVVPSDTTLEGLGSGDSRLTPCVGDRLIVQESELADMAVNGTVITQQESVLRHVNISEGDVLVESGQTRILDNSVLHGTLEIGSGAELRMDDSNVRRDGEAVIVKTTKPVLIVDSLIGISHFDSPTDLGEIVVPDGFGPPDVILIDSRADTDFPATCLDLHEAYCTP